MVRSSATVNDLSNANFTIKTASSSDPGPGKLVILQPKKNKEYYTAKTLVIKWTRYYLMKQPKIQKTKQMMAAGTSGKLMKLKTIKIEIRKAPCTPGTFSFPKWKIFKSSTADDGTFNRVIPFDYPAGCYRIRITENKAGGQKAVSGTFKIVQSGLAPIQPVF